MKMIWSFSGVQNDINQTTLWIDKFYAVCYNRDVKKKISAAEKKTRETCRYHELQGYENMTG